MLKMTLRCVLKLREALGNKIELRFDANQGYSRTGGPAFCGAYPQGQTGIDRAADPQKGSGSSGPDYRKVPLPVMADESIMSLRDAFRLARQGPGGHGQHQIDESRRYFTRPCGSAWLPGRPIWRSWSDAWMKRLWGSPPVCTLLWRGPMWPMRIWTGIWI